VRRNRAGTLVNRSILVRQTRSTQSQTHSHSFNSNSVVHTCCTVAPKHDSCYPTMGWRIRRKSLNPNSRPQDGLVYETAALSRSATSADAPRKASQHSRHSHFTTAMSSKESVFCSTDTRLGAPSKRPEPRSSIQLAHGRSEMS
jgi:hypothetical protein